MNAALSGSARLTTYEAAFYREGAGSDDIKGKKVSALSNCALEMSVDGLAVVDCGWCELFVGCGGCWLEDVAVEKSGCVSPS